MVNNKITFVVAVSRSSREDWEGHNIDDLTRVKVMLLPSLEKFIDTDSLEEVVYICPDKDFDHVNNLIKTSSIKSRVVTDSQLIDESIEFSSGWFKQQVLKLKIADHINTDHYILLDADMFATRKTSFSDLIINGKAKVGVLSYHTHKDWWENTADLLEYEIEYGLKDKVPGCTPQILYTELVKDLIVHLQTKVFPGEDWVRELCELCPKQEGDEVMWTEYCLYWIYVIKEKGLYNYYNEGETMLVNHSIWNEEIYNNMEEDHLHKMFYPFSNHHFSVVQSNIRNTKVQEIYQRIHEYVRGSAKAIGS